MAKEFDTPQEAFWAGEFGSEYVGRNQDDVVLAGRTHLMSKALSRAQRIGSAVEFGANIGMNMHALRRLLPDVELAAIEINPAAAAELAKIEGLTLHLVSILVPRVDHLYDLALIVGVLIHINPDALLAVYDNLYAASGRYILVAEYYSPNPVSVLDRGHTDRLFKRDFAGEMLDRFSDLKLFDYGFCYRQNPNFPLDHITWFLLEKS